MFNLFCFVWMVSITGNDVVYSRIEVFCIVRIVGGCNIRYSPILAKYL